VPCVDPQAHELDALVGAFPPRSLAAVVALRDTLLRYAQSNPVSAGRAACCVACARNTQPCGMDAGWWWRLGGAAAAVCAQHTLRATCSCAP
jgi:hypothetical protein